MSIIAAKVSPPKLGEAAVPVLAPTSHCGNLSARQVVATTFGYKQLFPSLTMPREKKGNLQKSVTWCPGTSGKKKKEKQGLTKEDILYIRSGDFYSLLV